MLLPEDRQLLKNTMDGLNLNPQDVETLLSTLNSTATEIDTPVSGVNNTWFGQSFTGGFRLATNADMAHEAVRGELAKMLAGLNSLSTNVEVFAGDVITVTEDTEASFTQFTAATECVSAPTFDSGQCSLPTSED